MQMPATTVHKEAIAADRAVQLSGPTSFRTTVAGGTLWRRFLRFFPGGLRDATYLDWETHSRQRRIPVGTRNLVVHSFEVC